MFPESRWWRAPRGIWIIASAAIRVFVAILDRALQPKGETGIFQRIGAVTISVGVAPIGIGRRGHNFASGLASDTEERESIAAGHRAAETFAWFPFSKPTPIAEFGMVIPGALQGGYSDFLDGQVRNGLL